MEGDDAPIPPRSRSHWRFDADDDLILLKEVAAENPFEDPSKWKVIAEKMKRVIAKPFNARNIRDRVAALLKNFEHHFQEWKYTSGKDEASSERLSLLEEARDMKIEFLSRRAKSNSKGQEMAKNMRDEAAMSAVAVPECSILVEDPTDDFEPLTTSPKPPELTSPPPSSPPLSQPTSNLHGATSSTPMGNGAFVHARRPVKRRRGVNGSVEGYMQKQQAHNMLMERRKLALEERHADMEARRLKLQENAQRKEEDTLTSIKLLLERQEAANNVIINMLGEVVKILMSKSSR